MQRHHQFFQRRITSTLTDPIDGALQLPSAIFDGLEKVGHSQP